MKDLYAELKVQPTADEQELAAVLQNHPGAESMEAILLDR